MTNGDLAQGPLATAQAILAEAGRLRAAAAYPLVVRRCQEVIELSLKAALRAAGLDVPHVHDVGTALLAHPERFPEPLRASLPHLASLSRRYRREREAAFYGDEEIGAPPSALYRAEDADEALAAAREVCGACADFVAQVRLNG